MIQPEVAEILWKNAVIGLCEVDLSGNFIKVNPSLCSLFEYSEAELQRLTFQRITHPDDLADDLEMVHRVIEGQLDFYTMTKRYITKSNKIILAKLRVDAIKCEDGTLRAFLSQVSPASYVVNELPTIESSKSTPVELVKKHPHWATGFILGVGILLYSMLIDPTYRQFGEMLILISMGGYNLQRDVSLGKKS